MSITPDRAHSRFIATGSALKSLKAHTTGLKGELTKLRTKASDAAVAIEALDLRKQALANNKHDLDRVAARQRDLAETCKAQEAMLPETQAALDETMAQQRELTELEKTLAAAIAAPGFTDFETERALLVEDFTSATKEGEKVTVDVNKALDQIETLERTEKLQEAAYYRRVLSYPAKLRRHIQAGATHGFPVKQTKADYRNARVAAQQLLGIEQGVSETDLMAACAAALPG